MENLIVLALLACPVGMGVMMWMMARGRGSSDSGDAEVLSTTPASLEQLREEQARLAAEIARRAADDGRESTGLETRI